MNKIINTLSFTADEFIYSACGSFTKHCERIQELRETGNLKHLHRMDQTTLVLLMMQHILIIKIQQKEQIRVCKIELIKLLEVVTMIDIKEHQEAWSISFFDKKAESGISIKEQIVKELHKQVTEKFNRRKVYTGFKDNI